MSFALAQALNGLAYAATLFLIAAGLGLVFGVMRITNFAHGSLAMLGAYIAYSLVMRLGGAQSTAIYLASMLLAALAVGVIGIVLDRVLLSRLADLPELFQLLATFAVVLIVNDLSQRIWGPQELFAPRVPGFRGAVLIDGEPFPSWHIVTIVAALLVWASMTLALKRTRWGLLVRAATLDREMTAALGVDQRRLFSSVMFVGAALAGLGGALLLPTTTVNLQMDLALVVEAFVVVVIGGMGSLGGAALAALLVGELHVFGIWLLPEATLVLMFVAMAVVLTLRPAGLFGRVSTRPDPGLRIGDRPAPDRWQPRSVVTPIAFMATLALLPWSGSDYATLMANEMMVFALYALSLQLLVGQAGIVSFGHAAFFGAGGYVVALGFEHLGIAPGLGLLLAIPSGALLAALFAAFALRSAGIYLAMLSLAFAQILWSVAIQWVGLTGGDNGLLGIRAAGDGSAYWYAWLALGVALALGMLARRTVFMARLRAARDSPLRAAALGIDVRRVRILAFTISGAVAATGGALMTLQTGGAFPANLSIPVSVDGLSMLLLGGLHSVAGAVIGAFVFHGLEAEMIRLTEAWRLVLGATLLVLVLGFRGGLVGAWDRWRA
jgi:branched-chain amino acid transport system permease protein